MHLIRIIFAVLITRRSFENIFDLICTCELCERFILLSLQMLYKEMQLKCIFCKLYFLGSMP